MKLFSKIAIAAIAASSILSAAEVLDLTAQGFWQNSRNITYGEKEMTPAGKLLFTSKKLLTIDPTKKYTMKMDVATGKGDKTHFFLFGLIPAEANGKQYESLCIQTVSDTFTQLAKDVKKGDKTIVVKNASKWKTLKHLVIAYNAKEDFSDLPNRQIIRSYVESVKQEGDNWIITLNKPVNVDLTAGTNVRQHAAGGYFYFQALFMSPEKNATLSKTITGKAVQGSFTSTAFPPAMTHAYIVILANWNNSNIPVTIKNATLTIE